MTLWTPIQAGFCQRRLESNIHGWRLLSVQRSYKCLPFKFSVCSQFSSRLWPTLMYPQAEYELYEP